MYKLYIECAGSEEIWDINFASKDILVDIVSNKFDVPYKVANKLMKENTLLYNDIFFQIVEV